jgi:hypothetical protein
MFNINIIYLSQTDPDQLVDLFESKLKKNELPTNLDYLRLAYLPQIKKRLRKKNVQSNLKRRVGGKRF